MTRMTPVLALSLVILLYCISFGAEAQPWQCVTRNINANNAVVDGLHARVPMTDPDPNPQLFAWSIRMNELRPYAQVTRSATVCTGVNKPRRARMRAAEAAAEALAKVYSYDRPFNDLRPGLCLMMNHQGQMVPRKQSWIHQVTATARTGLVAPERVRYVHTQAILLNCGGWPPYWPTPTQTPETYYIIR
jgi:hypothetical protein